MSDVDQAEVQAAQQHLSSFEDSLPPLLKMIVQPRMFYWRERAEEEPNEVVAEAEEWFENFKSKGRKKEDG